MHHPDTFNPDQIAYYETEGWRAYYDRRWGRVFWILVQLNRSQFRMPWFTALAAALDTARASKAFAPVDNDLSKTKVCLEQFFSKAKRSLDIKAGADKLAELELNYWVVHRQLAVQRAETPNDGNIEPMVQALAELHAALFNATPQEMRSSAELRGLAAKTVDDITGHRSKDIAADWLLIEDYLRQAYRAVQVAVT